MSGFRWVKGVEDQRVEVLCANSVDRSSFS
jgi:hypothetical protein